MQAIEHDGTRREPELYEPERLQALLDDEKVKEVRVFRLKKGMILNIGGAKYKIIAVRMNNKVTMKLI